MFVDKEFVVNIELADSPILNNSLFHKAFIVDFSIYHYQKISNGLKFRKDYDRADFVAMNNYLESVLWNNILSSLDLEAMYDTFFSILNSTISRFVPVKKSILNGHPVWFNRRLLNLKNKKNKAYKRFRKDRSNMELKSWYMLCQKEFDVLNKFLYRGYILSCEHKLKSNSKFFWNFINSKRNTNGLPNLMYFMDSSSNDTKAICDYFADYFSSVYSINDGPDSFSNLESMINLGDLQFDRLDIEKALTDLKGIKSEGPDGISPILLKNCATSLSFPLHLILSKSIASGSFLDIWKISHIVPIHKSGPKQNVINYRPICKIPSIPKLFEKLITNKISSVVKNCISVLQHGFIQGRSTCTNLSLFCNFVIKNFEIGLQTDVVFTDFAKAFDRVSHKTLIRKLSCLGFHSNLLDWIESYLRNRVQFVKIDNSLSKPINVTSGVPQGSHLGPLLFLLFINDLPNVIKHSECLLFADDLKVYRAIKTKNDCNLLQEDINAVDEWCVFNNLPLNTSKCQCFTLSRSLTSILHCYGIKNCPLDRVTSKKDLGILLDPRLTFNEHIDYVICKANSMLGFLKRNSRDFTDPYTLKTLFISLVRPHLEYCSIIWNPSYNLHSYRIERVQKSFTRFLFFKLNWRIETPSYKSRLLLINLNALECRRKYFCVMFVRDLIHCQIQCPTLLSMLDFYSPSRILRCQFHFRERIHRTNYAQNEPIARCINEANSVLALIDIFENCSRLKFKNDLLLTLSDNV